MIRSRIPHLDDARLFRMIQKRLLPYARQARPDVVFKRSDILERWRQCRVFVAIQAEEKVAGFISCRMDGSTLEIDMLAVAKNAEGRGLGKALISTAERYGLRKGADAVRLLVDEPNIHAQRFYMRQGFMYEDYLPQQNMHVMLKRLTS